MKRPWRADAPLVRWLRSALAVGAIPATAAWVPYALGAALAVLALYHCSPVREEALAALRRPAAWARGSPAGGRGPLAACWTYASASVAASAGVVAVLVLGAASPTWAAAAALILAAERVPAWAAGVARATACVLAAAGLAALAWPSAAQAAPRDPGYAPPSPRRYWLSERRWVTLVTLLGLLAASCAPAAPAPPTAAPAPATAAVAPPTPAPSSIWTPTPDTTPAASAPATPSPSDARATGAAAAPAAAPSSPSAGAPTPSLSLVLTISGSPAPFDRPNAVAVDREGRIYVGENAPGHTVQVFDRAGTFLRKWGGQGGSGEGQFQYITSLAVDADGNVYAADFENRRVQKFDPTGRFLLQVATEPPTGPSGVAVDPQGSIYIVNHRRHDHYVQKFDAAGRPLLAWGDNGSGPGQFVAGGTGGPDQVALDAEGNVYVSDPDNARVQKFDPTGRFLMQFGGSGAGDGQFIPGVGPYGLAVDPQGNVYALDQSGTLQKFDRAGRFVAKWSSTGGSRMMAVDEHGDLYIRDLNNRGVKKYRQP